MAPVAILMRLLGLIFLVKYFAFLQKPFAFLAELGHTFLTVDAKAKTGSEPGQAPTNQERN
jgi:hypothetical protein